MDLFDLHCDTAYECAAKLGGVSLTQGAEHLSLKRGRIFRRWTQVFAVFMPDELRGEAAVAHYEKVRDYLYTQERQCAGQFRIVRNRAELHEQTARCAAILSVEGGSALAGQPERVQALYDDGVRLMTLTWNDRNEIGDGIRVPGGKGLTDFGRTIVKEMERLRMAIDVSHLSDAGFYEVAEQTQAPFVASHSNARRLCGNERNLTDEMIDVMASRGGLIGLNFFREFLRDDGNAHMTDILRHADYFLSRGCEKCLSLGSDFDGCEIPEDMTGVESMADLYEAFLREKYSEKLVKDIFYYNAERYFTNYIFLRMDR